MLTYITNKTKYMLKFIVALTHKRETLWYLLCDSRNHCSLQDKHNYSPQNALILHADNSSQDMSLK